DGLGVDPDGAGDVALVVLAPGPDVQQAEVRLAKAVLQLVECDQASGRLGRVRTRLPGDQRRTEDNDRQCVHENLVSRTGPKRSDPTDRPPRGQPPSSRQTTLAKPACSAPAHFPPTPLSRQPRTPSAPPS